jgi:hypothetical protein
MSSMAGANTPNGEDALVDAGLVWLADTVVPPCSCSFISACHTFRRMRHPPLRQFRCRIISN